MSSIVLDLARIILSVWTLWLAAELTCAPARADEIPQASSTARPGGFSLRPDEQDAGSQDDDDAINWFSPELRTEELFREAPPPRAWYVDFGLRLGYTRLGETGDLLAKRLEIPLALDVLDIWEHPDTPLDRRSRGGLTTFYLGIGRRQNEWLTWNFYVGGGTGDDRNHQRIANLNVNVDFEYVHYYFGLSADIYPWGIPAYRPFTNWLERLKASRPYVIAGFENGYLGATGEGNFKFAPLVLYADQGKVRDWLMSFQFGIGWELPINERWSFNVAAYHAFHIYRPDEYNSWDAVFAFRYRF